jgi:hypothetical protein
MSFLAVRICVLVIVPGLLLSALVQAAVGLWARRRGQGPVASAQYDSG